MARECLSCGTSMDGRRSHARYCSDVCRKRGGRAGLVAPVPDLPTGRLADSTRAELGAMGVAGALADAAILLAEHADAADARAVPALMREWRAAMAEARSAATVAAANPLDELRRRRERTG